MCSKHRLAKKKILSPALSQKMFVHYEFSLGCEMFNLSETGICKRQEMENETMKGGEVTVKKKEDGCFLSEQSPTEASKIPFRL